MLPVVRVSQPEDQQSVLPQSAETLSGGKSWCQNSQWQQVMASKPSVTAGHCIESAAGVEPSAAAGHGREIPGHGIRGIRHTLLDQYWTLSQCGILYSLATEAWTAAEPHERTRQQCFHRLGIAIQQLAAHVGRPGMCMWQLRREHHSVPES